MRLFEGFILFTSVVTPPATPRYVRGIRSGWTTASRSHDADHWSSDAAVTFSDVAGAHGAALAGARTATAERMQ